MMWTVSRKGVLRVKGHKSEIEGDGNNDDTKGDDEDGSNEEEVEDEAENEGEN